MFVLYFLLEMFLNIQIKLKWLLSFRVDCIHYILFVQVGTTSSTAVDPLPALAKVTRVMSLI